jgi:hypothetical protein
MERIDGCHAFCVVLPVSCLHGDFAEVKGDGNAFPRRHLPPRRIVFWATHTKLQEYSMTLISAAASSGLCLTRLGLRREVY